MEPPKKKMKSKASIGETSQFISPTSSMDGKIFNDSIYGSMEFHPFLVKIIDTPQFQRLRSIKQLGGAYFVYPGASHNRFEHSLGASHLAGVFARSLQEKQEELQINERDILCVQIAALCHDLGHGPFSHMFEKMFIPEVRPNLERKWDHETMSVEIFDYIVGKLKENGFDLEKELKKMKKEELGKLNKKQLNDLFLQMEAELEMLKELEELKEKQLHMLKELELKGLRQQKLWKLNNVKELKELEEIRDLQVNMLQMLGPLEVDLEDLKELELKKLKKLEELRELGLIKLEELMKFNKVKESEESEESLELEDLMKMEMKRLKELQELEQKKLKRLKKMEIMELEELTEEDEENDLVFIKEMIKKPEGEYKGRKSNKSFLYEIVANERNGIDVDKFDYFARDCHHLGLSNNFDHRRFIKFARVIKCSESPQDSGPSQLQICIRDKELPNIYEMFHTRCRLHQKAYQHKTTKIIELMIKEAFIKANPKLKISAPITDEDVDIESYTKLTDDIFGNILYSDSEEPGMKEARKILTNVVTRKIPKYLGKTKRLSQVTKVTKVTKVTEDLKKQWKNELAAAHQDASVKLTEKDFEIIITTIDFGIGSENPIDHLCFYSKSNNKEASPIRKEEVSVFLLPHQFSEEWIYVYYTRLDGNNTVAYKHFRKWCRKNGFLVPRSYDEDSSNDGEGH